ncbi:MAG: LLM class flavin-dependent oxidoreductase, partial [Pseudoxanthomonas sp.]
SSMFGGSLAAALGLPHGFASHFAPDELERSVAYYRANFQPSAQLDAPYVVAGVNVFAADTTEEAEAHLLTSQRRRVGLFVDRNRRFTDEEADELLASRHGLHVQAMARCSAVGTPEQVAETLSHWYLAHAADGFNIMPDMFPSGVEIFVDEVVPLLQKRGLFRHEYTGSTLREHLGLPFPGNQYALRA